MPWTNLATVKLGNDWKFTTVNFQDYELFRITHIFDPNTYGKCLLCQAYEDPPSFFDFHSFLPTVEPRIFNAFFITAYYTQLMANTLQRNFALKFVPFRPSKKTAYYFKLMGMTLPSKTAPNWSVQIEVYT